MYYVCYLVKLVPDISIIQMCLQLTKTLVKYTHVSFKSFKRVQKHLTKGLSGDLAGGQKM